MKNAATTVITVCLMTSLWTAQAAEHTVPTDFKTIQQAVDAAQLGDVIHIQPGHYTGPIHFKNGVTLSGVAPGQVVVECPPESGPALTASHCDQGTISGISFTFTTATTKTNKKSSTPALCEVENSSIGIENCEASGGIGDGFDIRGNGSPTLKSCKSLKNARNGFFVTGPNAAPKLIHNTAS